MKTITGILICFLAISITAPSGIQAQQTGDSEFVELFNGHFRYASRVLSLAKAMPADKYSWRPGEEVLSIEEVYAHLAYYNYFILEQMGYEAPSDVDVENIENITGKEAVVDILDRSIAYVNDTVKDMPLSKLSETSELYGRTFTGKGLLLQLITHMSEHVGQSIAYARTNGVVPPWSR